MPYSLNVHTTRISNINTVCSITIVDSSKPDEIWAGYNFYDLSGMPDAKIVATQFHINSNMAVVFYALFSLLSFSKLV